MNQIKILILDIENFPNEADVWGLYNQNIGINQILEVGRMICYAAKWLGSDDIIFLGQTDNISRKIMLDTLWRQLDEADAVIHYNGTKFDTKVINAEFIKEGYPPPSPYKNIDLFKEIKRNFRLPSYKLDFILQYFGIGKKVEHEGHELWQRVRRGEKLAWKKMEEYNKGDVIPLEMLYNRLRPWIKVHPNLGLYVNSSLPVCRICGGKELVKNGFEYLTVGKYQRYRCKACGAPGRSRTIMNTDRGHLTVGVK